MVASAGAASSDADPATSALMSGEMPCMISGANGSASAASISALEYGIFSVAMMPRWNTTAAARSAHLAAEAAGSTKIRTKSGSRTSAAQVTRRKTRRWRIDQKSGVRAICIFSAACMAEPPRHIGLENL